MYQAEAPLKHNQPDPLEVPRQMNVIWSMDFIHGPLADGRSFRSFNVLDGYNRAGLYVKMDLSLPAPRAICALEQIIA